MAFNRRGFLCVVALLGAPACSTTPVSQVTASPGRAYAYQAQAPGTVPVTIVRDGGIMSAACSTEISVDGRAAGSVGAGQRITLHLPPGELIIGAQQSGLCAGGLAEREANVVAGRPMAFRIGFDHNGSMGLYRTAAR